MMALTPATTALATITVGTTTVTVLHAFERFGEIAVDEVVDSHELQSGTFDCLSERLYFRSTRSANLRSTR
jgi:hypothetical protein